CSARALMVSIKNPRGITFVTNKYDFAGRVSDQTVPDGTYHFDYQTYPDGSISQTKVTDPRGIAEQLQFNADGYLTTDIRALNQLEQQTVTYDLEPGTNRVFTMTDSLRRNTKYE